MMKKFKTRFEYVISKYVLKSGKNIHDLAICFLKNWRGPTQKRFNVWKIEIWAPVSGENSILVCYGIDMKWSKGNVTGQDVQKTIYGLNDIIVSSKTKSNVYHIILGKCIGLNKSNEAIRGRYLVISQYTLKKGKKIEVFLDRLHLFCRMLREMQDKVGVECVEVLELEPKKPHIINCRYTIFNYDNWKKKSAEMEKSMRDLVDQSKTLTKVYSSISCIPEADSELDRSMNYIFERIEKEKRRGK